MGPNIEVAFGGKREEARPGIDRPLRRSWSHKREGKGGNKVFFRSLDSVRQGGGACTIMYVMHVCLYQSMYCCICRARQEDWRVCWKKQAGNTGDAELL